MSTIRRQAWRIALVASGLATINGGRLHPGADPADPFRQELATMTAHEHWVPGHILTMVGAILLVVGLRLATRLEWSARTVRALRIGSMVFALYVVETVAHLMSFVDSHALATGGSAPVAMTHVALATVLYPLSGAALVHLAVTLAREWPLPWRLVAVVGVVAGVVHALSVPMTLLLPDAELSPMFAVAGVGTALWAIGTAVAPGPRRVAAAAAEEERLTAAV